MSRQDYAHHNEDALSYWWAEEGRHPYEPDEETWYDRDVWDVDDNGDDPGWVEHVRERDAQFARAEAAYERDEMERQARERG